MPETVRDAAQAETAEAVHPGQPAPRLTLNSDGRPHPVLNGLALFTLIAGVVAFVLGLIVKAHFAATVIGIGAFVIGLGAQLNSATREQRVLIVTGIIGAFVGMALGIAHGGFT